MSLADLQSALNMRDLIYSMVEEMVERLRPEEKIGKVYSFSQTSNTAQILFAGETVQSLVVASFSEQNTPRTAMSSTWSLYGYGANGDLVRVAGRPGKYYIVDYVNGGPESYYTGEIGIVKMWLGANVPADHLLLDGSTFSGSSYPLLASIVGDAYGTHSGDVYYLPDFRSRSPMGVGNLDINGWFAMSRGLKWGSDTHLLTWQQSGLRDHTHDSVGHNYFGGGVGGGLLVATQAASNWAISQGTVTFGAAHATEAHPIVHPVLGVNFIVRAK
jgi:microcystin-dependent protein